VISIHLNLPSAITKSEKAKKKKFQKCLKIICPSKERKKEIQNANQNSNDQQSFKMNDFYFIALHHITNRFSN
jgi:hypothetical protein